MSEQAKVSQEQAIDAAFHDSLEDMILVLEGVGPQCSDLQELIDMLKLAVKNTSQRQLIMAHLAPKRMKR